MPLVRIDISKTASRERVRDAPTERGQRGWQLVFARVEIGNAITDRVKEQLRIRVADQRTLAVCLRGAARGDAERRGSHTLGDVPGVVVGSRHELIIYANYPYAVEVPLLEGRAHVVPAQLSALPLGVCSTRSL